MAQERIRYRRLPGKRRGILMGSSVWMGPDHLLLVKSSRFREEYKRFYLREIQAIVVAEAPRFHISTRSLLIGAVWSFAFFTSLGYGIGSGKPALAWVTGGIGVALALAWVYISSVSSCRCRLFTAVSSEPLPSIYRTWTARRFLEQVEPYIAQVQGVIEGSWVEAAEERQIGPLAPGRIAPQPAAVADAASMPASAPSELFLQSPGMVLLPGEAPPPVVGLGANLPTREAHTRTLPAMLLVVSLLLGGAAELLSVRTGVVVARWIIVVSIVLQGAAAVGVMVQYFQGGLRPAMRNLAIVMLAATGIWYYAVQIAAGMAMGMENARHPERTSVNLQENQLAFTNFAWSRGSAGVINLLLGFAGVIILLRGDRSNQPVSFNV